MENKNTKLYYSISEVSEMLDINASHIRFWEKEFSNFIKPKKNRNGKRLFTIGDIDVLKRIKFLTKEQGYTLPGARNMLVSEKKKLDKNIELSDTLHKLKNFLTDLKKQLNTEGNANQ